MKIVCLVKITPDVEEFQYDYEHNVLRRENVKQIINPDDACALGFAVQLKKKHPEVEIEVVSMAPLSAVPLMEEILRRRVDRATLLSDPKFGGSDTLATSRIIGSYLKQTEYDVILSGDHSIDGDTAHIPSQLAEYLGIDQLSSVIRVSEEDFLQGKPVVEVDNDQYLETYELTLPAILSFHRASKIRLPFVRFADLDLDVHDQLQILNHEDLGLVPEQIGHRGSATRVVKTWTRDYEKKQARIFVKNDEAGVDAVYHFLKENGYLS